MKTPATLQLPDIQESFNEVWRAIGAFTDGNPDLHGRRFINAGDAKANQDFLTFGQADIRYAKKSDILAAQTLTAAKSVRIGAFSSRAGAFAFPFTFFEANDWNFVGWVSDGNNWLYAYGIYKRTQSQLSALASLLGSNDMGFLVNVTDFSHILQWSGSAWQWGPGELGSNYFAVAPSAPTGGTWQLCDGTATTYLKSDGTTGSYTTKNLTGHYFKSVTAGADATTAAVAPGISGSTANESSHTHGPGSFTVSGNTDGVGSSVVQSGSGANAVAGHNHTITSQPVSGTSDPGSAHLHGIGTIAVDATGEPANYKVLTYFRR